MHISKELSPIIIVVCDKYYFIIQFKQLLESLYQLRGGSRGGDLLQSESLIKNELIRVIVFRIVTAVWR